MDIRIIRKHISRNTSFHLHIDVDKQHIPRYQGGNGLKSVQALFECRIVSFYIYLEKTKEGNVAKSFMYTQEQKLQCVKAKNRRAIIASLKLLMRYLKWLAESCYDKFRGKSQPTTNKKPFIDAVNAWQKMLDRDGIDKEHS